MRACHLLCATLLLPAAVAAQVTPVDTIALVRYATTLRQALETPVRPTPPDRRGERLDAIIPPAAYTSLHEALLRAAHRETGAIHSYWRARADSLTSPCVLPFPPYDWTGPVQTAYPSEQPCIAARTEERDDPRIKQARLRLAQARDRLFQGIDADLQRARTP